MLLRLSHAGCIGDSLPFTVSSTPSYVSQPFIHPPADGQSAVSILVVMMSRPATDIRVLVLVWDYVFISPG